MSTHVVHPEPAVCDLIAEAEKRGAERALDRLLIRADEGIEFGPDNYTRLVRMVREVRTSPGCGCAHKMIAGCDHE